MKAENLVILSTLGAIGSLVLSGCTTTGTGETATVTNSGFLSSYSGFKQKSKLKDEVVYHGDLAKTNEFQKIYLEEVVVKRPSDMEKKKITTEDLLKLQDLFKSSLQEQIEVSRFALATGPGPETLSVRAAIVDIQPGDPALFLASGAPYVGAATTAVGVATGAKFGRGSAKLEVELLDSESRERIAGLIDENVGSKLEIVQGMSRWGHVELAVKQWSKRFARFIADPTSFSDS